MKNVGCLWLPLRKKKFLKSWNSNMSSKHYNILVPIKKKESEFCSLYVLMYTKLLKYYHTF